MSKRIEFEGQVHEFPDDFTDDEIQAALSSPGKPGDAFRSRYGLGGTGLAESPGGRFAGGMKDVATGAYETGKNLYKASVGRLMGGVPPAEAQEANRAMLRGIVDPHLETGKRAIEASQQGNRSKAAVYGTAAAVPIAGPMLLNWGERAAAGDIAGPLGELTAGALPTVGRLGMKAAFPKLAPGVMRGALRPSSNLSLADQEAVVQRALKRDFPTGVGDETAPRELRSTLITKESMYDLNRDIAREKAQVTAGTTAGTPAGNATIPLRELTNPIREIIKGQQKIGTPTRVLEKLIENYESKYEDWLTVAEAQEFKELVSKHVPDIAYKEGAQPAPRAMGQKAAQTGARKAIEQTVPIVAKMNRAIRLDIELKNAINAAIKRYPGFLRDVAPWALGSGAFYSFGEGGVAGGMMAAAVVRAAIRNPEIMSKLAIALDKAGTGIGSKTVGASPLLAPISIQREFPVWENNENTK